MKTGIDKIFIKMMKSLLISIIPIFTLFGMAKGQTPNEGLLLKNSLIYFCNNVLNEDANLKSVDIKFKGSTSSKYSQFYYIADCVEDISLIKNEIPIKVSLDSLQSIYDKKNTDAIKLNYSCIRLKKNILNPFNKRAYRLYLYKPIRYNGYYYVEYYLINKLSQAYIVGVKLNEEYKAINYCKKSYVY